MKSPAGHRPGRLGEEPVGDQRLPTRSQRVPHEEQVGGQRRTVAINTTGLRGGAVAELALGVLQLQAHADGLEPVRLLGVEPEVALLDFRQGGEVCLEGRHQLRGRRAQPAGQRELATEAVHQIEGVVDSVLSLQADHLQGDRRRDVGVAVPVPTDPGAER